MPALVLGALALALGVGLAVAVNPMLAIAALLPVGLLLLGAHARSGAPRLFAISVVALLAGYALFGRGFAYLGVRPVFVGEIVLALGLVAVVPYGLARVLRSPISWILLAFAGWGALRTLPFLGAYGTDALRDAVLWAYGAYALLVAAVVLRLDAFQKIPALFDRLVPWMLLWIPFATLLRPVFGFDPPTPWVPEIPLVALKGGDAAVHLAGIAAFLGLGFLGAARAKRRNLSEWFWWMLWLVDFVIVCSQSRGGMMSVFVALLVLAALKPLARWWKVVPLAVVSVAVFMAANVEYDIGWDRKVSPQQVAANLLSVFGSYERDALQGTAQWRKEWWRDILEYTVFGPYRWGGKGYGVNLALDDGVVGGPGVFELRSPHNGHLTVLARSGVPGFALWVLLHVWWVVALMRALARFRRTGAHGFEKLAVWTLAYWAAFMTNATFDVYLEGPQGGIWYWSVFGFGIALSLVNARPIPPKFPTDPTPWSAT